MSEHRLMQSAVKPKMNYLKLGILPILFLLSLFSIIAPIVPASGSCGTVPSSVNPLVTGCIPLNIINTQNSVTPNGFQIMVTNTPVNAIAGNIIIYNGISASLLSTWAESSNTLWINLGANTIAALSSANGVYYIGFGSSSTNFFTTTFGNDIGEAPQLSSSYAQYDNGNIVFPILYQNWFGTSIPTGWGKKDTNNVISISNGLIMGANPSGDSDIHTTAVYGTNTFQILDTYGKFGVQPTSNNWGSIFGYGAITGGGVPQFLFATDPSGSGLSNTLQIYTSVSGFQYTGNFNIGNYHVFSLYAPTHNGIGYQDYSMATTLANGLSGTSNIAFRSLFNSNSMLDYWVRIRDYPPNGIMPTVAYQSSQTSNSAIPTLTILPNPSTYGQSITITANCQSGDTCDIDYPSLGTHLATGTTTATYTYPGNALGVGTYSNYYANDITINANSVTQTITVNKATTPLTWIAQCSIQGALPCTTTANIMTYNNQIYGTLWVGTSNTGTTNTQISNSVSVYGSYTYTFNTLGNGNYLSKSISYSFTSLAVTVPANILYFIPVGITNLQTNAVAANTPIPIGSQTFGNVVGFNALPFSSYFISNMINTEWFFINGTVIRSWLEGNILNGKTSNSLSTSKNVSWWIDLGPATNSLLPASMTSNYIIYLGIAGNTPSTQNSLWSLTDGVAPQLTCTNPANTITGCSPGQYGKYDNGNTIFSFYDNFAGNTISGSWTNSIQSGLSDIVNNGLYLSSNTLFTNYMLTNTYSSNVPITADAYITFSSGWTGAANAGFTFNSLNWNGDLSEWTNPSGFIGWSTPIQGSHSNITSSPTATIGSSWIMSYYTSNGYQVASVNYSRILQSWLGGGNPSNRITGGLFSIELYENQQANAPVFYQWIRTRIAPPNSINPITESIGNLRIAPPQFTPVLQMPSTPIFPYPIAGYNTIINLTTVMPANDGYTPYEMYALWSYNSSTYGDLPVPPFSGSAESNESPLGLTYCGLNYYLNYWSEPISPGTVVPCNFNISNVSEVPEGTYSVASFVFDNGTPPDFIPNSNQSLEYVSSVAVEPVLIQQSNSVVTLGQNNVYTIYIANSVPPLINSPGPYTVNLVINQAYYYPLGQISSSNILYGNIVYRAFSFNAFPTAGYLTVGVSLFDTVSHNTYTTPVGLSVETDVLFPGNIPTLSISPNPSTYGNSITITATCNHGDTCDIDYPSLGTHLATGTTTATYTYPGNALGVGTYSNYYANDITINANSVTQTITVNKATTPLTWIAQCSIQGALPCTTTANIITFQNQIYATLWEGTSNTGTTNTQISNSIDALGSYTYTFNTLGNGNYVSNGITYSFSESTPNAPTYSSTGGFQIPYGTSTTLSGTCSTSDTCNIIISGTQVASATTTVNYNFVSGPSGYSVGTYPVLFCDANSNTCTPDPSLLVYSPVYLQNNTGNPAVTFPTLAGVPACSANTLSGTCIGNDIISGTQVLTGSLSVIGNIIVKSGSTLTTNGYAIISSVGFNSIGATLNAGTAPNAAPSSGAAGGSLPLSYGASGGASGQGEGASGGLGGNTLALGGQTSGASGSLPSAPTITSSNVMLFASSPKLYLSGAGGGESTQAGIAGNGAYGIFIEAPNVLIGGLSMNGVSGSGSCNGAGGGGAGRAFIAYKIQYSLTNAAFVGGAGGTASGCGGAGANGGAGGNGNIIAENSVYSSIYIPQIYPIKLYTTNNLITYTINSVVGNIQTILQGPTNTLSYVPSSYQPSNTYIYNVIETNGISIASFSINISINMTDISSNLGFSGECSTIIQYFPNCAMAPTFTATPTSWSIQSDNPLNSYGNGNFVSGTNNIAVWSNTNLTFTPNIILTYGKFSPSIIFSANLVNNPAVNSITQNAFRFIASNIIPSSPNTRLLYNTTTYDQQFLTPLNAVTTSTFNWLFNNYSGSASVKETTNITNSLGMDIAQNSTWMGNSLYANPSIQLSNFSTLSTAALHYATINNFFSNTINDGTWPTYPIYLANNANASLYTFYIYECSGYAPTNSYIWSYTGSSSSASTAVQKYKINAIPFSLPLQNGQQYGFQFWTAGQALIYTQAPSVNPLTITIYLPCQRLNVTNPAPVINATCNTNTISNVVTCQGIDTQDYVGLWQISLTYHPNIFTTQTLATNVIPGSSFIWSYQLPNHTTVFYATINATIGRNIDPIFAVMTNFPLFSLGYSINPTQSYDAIFGILLFFIFIGVAYINEVAAMIGFPMIMILGTELQIFQFAPQYIFGSVGLMIVIGILMLIFRD